MFEKQSAELFVRQLPGAVLIDVRSPAEYATGHIPGSFNIPLFDDSECAEIGTIYKHQGKQPAIDRGLEIVGPKMISMVLQARQLTKGKKVLMYCWRGGMRSGSMAWLFETAGIPVTLLEHGYKGFRQCGKSLLAQPSKIIVIGGYTGSGKTKVLKALESLGEQVLDIEHLARHRGSSFGAIGKEYQKTNEQFENDLLMEWISFDTGKSIWVEDESRVLGSNQIPEELFLKIRNAPVYKLEIPKTERVKNLVEDYSVYDFHQLESAVLRIQSKLGGLATKNALKALMDKDFGEVASISLDYYDKTYAFGLAKRDPDKVFTFDFHQFDAHHIAKKFLHNSKNIEL
jgi:tRNA 2-selenouridine synthase